MVLRLTVQLDCSSCLCGGSFFGFCHQHRIFYNHSFCWRFCYQNRFLRQRFPLVALLPERSFLQLQSVLELVSVPEQVLYRKRKIVGINPAIIIPIIRIPAFIPSHAMGITGVLCGDVPGIFDFVLCCLCSV